MTSPVLIPELIHEIISKVDNPKTFLSCLQVNREWNKEGKTLVSMKKREFVKKHKRSYTKPKGDLGIVKESYYTLPNGDLHGIHKCLTVGGYIRLTNYVDGSNVGLETMRSVIDPTTKGFFYMEPYEKSTLSLAVREDGSILTMVSNPEMGLCTTRKFKEEVLERETITEPSGFTQKTKFRNGWKDDVNTYYKGKLHGYNNGRLYINGVVQELDNTTWKVGLVYLVLVLITAFVLIRFPRMRSFYLCSCFLYSLYPLAILLYPLILGIVRGFNMREPSVSTVI